MKALKKKLQAKGIVLKPFVIGIGLDQDYLDRFNCHLLGVVSAFLGLRIDDSSVTGLAKQGFPRGECLIVYTSWWENRVDVHG